MTTYMYTCTLYLKFYLQTKSRSSPFTTPDRVQTLHQQQNKDETTQRLARSAAASAASQLFTSTCFRFFSSASRPSSQVAMLTRAAVTTQLWDGAGQEQTSMHRSKSAPVSTSHSDVFAQLNGIFFCDVIRFLIPALYQIIMLLGLLATYVWGSS